MNKEWIKYGKPYSEFYIDDLNKEGTLIEVKIPNYVFDYDKGKSYLKGRRN